MLFNICLAVVDEFEVGTGDDLLLRELLAHPGENLGAGDVVTIHDATDAYLQRGGDNDDTIHEAGDARLAMRREMPDSYMMALSSHWSPLASKSRNTAGWTMVSMAAALASEASRKRATTALLSCDSAV